MVTFGYEFEVAGNGTSVLYALHRMGAVANDYLCPYHGCGGDCCAHDNTDWLFSAQEDCTVSAEFPSKILEWGSDRAEEAFLVMERAAAVGGAELEGDSGMHVHVAKTGTQRDGSSHLTKAGTPRKRYRFTEREKETWRVLRIFMRYQDDLEDIAAAARPRNRGYNHRLNLPDDPSWLAYPDARKDVFWDTNLEGYAKLWEDIDPSGRYGRGAILNPMHSIVFGSYLDVSRHSHTYEFRLWNAAAAAWRQRLAVGMSVAMTLAARDGVDVTETDPRPLEEVVGPYLDDTMWTSLMRQKYGKGGIQ